MPRKPTGNPPGRPRTRQSTPEVERLRENARRYYYGIPPILKEPGPRLSDAERKQRANDDNRNRRQKVIDALADYKLAKQCTDCDRTFTKSYHLDFDHLPGAVKSFNLSKPGGRSWEAVMAEVDKCEVVCALCHRDRTMARKANNSAYGQHRPKNPAQQTQLWET